MSEVQYTSERLDHLGIVAGVCREIGLAPYLDALDTHAHERVSVGTAVVAMLLNGLGFSNRRLYLTPQFFANKPIERLLGPGILAEDLNDDCLGRALDWVAAHDPTALFAGIAQHARQRFGVKVEQLHGDTTSFAVSGDYLSEEGNADAQAIAITYGYSRDHREDLKQWALALITSSDGDVPVFMRTLDGNSSDKQTIVAAHLACVQQMRDAHEEPGWAIADSALYSEANLRQFNAAQVAWITRVPETLTAAKEMVARTDISWQESVHPGTWWWRQEMNLPQGPEQWIVMRTQESEARCRATFTRQEQKLQAQWEKRVWHLRHRVFACEPDARMAGEQMLAEMPVWMMAQVGYVATDKQSRRGRPKAGAGATIQEWSVVITLHPDEALQEQEIRRRACFILATNRLAVSPDEVLTRYLDQGSVERGFRFLKDPLFLASSVFLQKPERIVALSLVMVLCLLIYRLAEMRLRRQLVATQQFIPDQLNKPTQHPTMRWVFQCFEGIDLLHIPARGGGSTTLVLQLTPLHERILTLLGSAFLYLYQITN
jgi:transposase